MPENWATRDCVPETDWDEAEGYYVIRAESSGRFGGSVSAGALMRGLVEALCSDYHGQTPETVADDLTPGHLASGGVAVVAVATSRSAGMYSDMKALVNAIDSYSPRVEANDVDNIQYTKEDPREMTW